MCNFTMLKHAFIQRQTRQTKYNMSPALSFIYDLIKFTNLKEKYTAYENLKDILRMEK